MKKILLVEDDSSLGKTLFQRLTEDYDVVWADSVQKANDAFSPTIDLAILDVGLPDGNGFDLAKDFQAKSQIPIIFLTAQADAESRLKGFELGAEEYIPKPFLLKELLLRVKHVLEQHSMTKELVLQDCKINFTTMSIHQKDGRIEYPPATDMKILQLLVEKSPRVLSRDQILTEIWGEDKNPNHRTVDNIIARLRNVLGTGGENYIRSVRGIGYQWSTEAQ
jgi:two-component system phosphate regulon response regulator PhoB